VTGVVSGQIGVQSGGTPKLLMKYVPLLADVVPGDVVVTSGLDQIYPKGLVLGRVDSIVGPGAMFKEVLLASAAHLDELEEVLVLLPIVTVSAFTESVR
jgi:rod shape-determining protein MreC